ncbi:MAG: hypothetical protein U1C33_01705 [Candidatus Cloacimonadaceae bacterium]|nr:hypothetical protein [Candidatus Cloacimonadaceae bacterium]
MLATALLLPIRRLADRRLCATGGWVLGGLVISRSPIASKGLYVSSSAACGNQEIATPDG